MNGNFPQYPNTEHDHQLDLVLMCGTCGLVMAAPETQAVARRLVRYVAPTITKSDNLTTADPAEVTFDLIETGTD